MTKNNSKKIIALLPFKNEGWIIGEYINSVKKITDHIIAYDDNSTDDSRKLLEKAGAKIIEKNYKTESYFAEHKIRQDLLEEGRKDGGTHFICLDADEIFSNNFIKQGREIIYSLKPSQGLWMDWVNLYGDIKNERKDDVYHNINKCFVFCDEANLTFPYAFVGVSRTPTSPENRIVIDRKQGSVIHFQFLNKERFLMKRVWYMCSELIKADRSALRINTTYDVQKDRKNIRKVPIDSDSAFEINNDSITEYDYKEDWRFKEIIRWFDKCGIGYFEPLDIWAEKVFQEEFVRRIGRPPSPKVLPGWLIKLNYIKNKIRNLF